MRLIDADALDKKSYPDKSEDWEEANWVVDLADIRSAPTISLTANWTPCSVALPDIKPDESAVSTREVKGLYLVTVMWKYKRAVAPMYFHVIRDSGRLLKIWEDFKTGAVVSTPEAWMPFPEPYRGEA